MKKLLIFTLLLSLTFGISMLYDNRVNADIYDNALQSAKLESILADSAQYVEGYDESSSYYGVYQHWSKIEGSTPDDAYILDYQDITGGEMIAQEDSLGYQDVTVKMLPTQTITLDFVVETEGLYEVYFDYYLLPETVLRPSISIQVNNEFQYNEMANIEIPLKWQVDTEKVFDRFGDELTPDSELVSEWNTFTLMDPNYFFIEPLKVYLSQGENHVSITLNEGFALFGDIVFENRYEESLSYSEYKMNQPSATEDVDTITLDAERYTYESKQNISAKFLRNPGLTPYSYKNRVLNIVDQTSFRKSGDSITYVFDVEETGYYNLSVKYLQSENNDLASRRAILIDGEIPFKELEQYPFDYSRKWRLETLGNENEDFLFYLEEGSHELTLQVFHTDIRDIYHGFTDILGRIDELSREINRITGGLTDRYRDYKLDVYIPTLIEDLKAIKADVIYYRSGVIDLFGEDIALINDLDLSIEYLDRFIEDPDEIPPFKRFFNEGDQSIYGRINTNLPLLIDSPLELDSLYFHAEDAALPKVNANFFVRVFEGLRSFFYSFFDEKYNEASVVDDQTVEIWVRQSRLYIQVMQRMIDEEFTEQTGIKVQLSVMPDENKIVLANAANSTPDAAMGLSVTRPFEFAIRGMVTDLSELDGFYELIDNYNVNSFLPFIYEEGIYSIPETMDVKLLFYRKDILEYLNVDPPQTWDEVIGLIPVMQKFNYSFYTPLGNDNAFKTFGETTPFIYQRYGELYNEAGDKVVINENGSYEAFEFMTDLFSVYNVPITTSNFYQKFRDGISPIGIGDGNTYIQLKYAAPELAGQWDVIPIPGIEYDKTEEECPGPMTDDRCIERWDPTYGTSSVIFNDSSKQDLVWEYFKWWFSTDIQSDFTYKLQSLLGDEFLHMTANVEAFKSSAWPSDSKYEILEQWEWVRTTGKIPGDYLVERELSNAWNKVVNDGVSARVAIDDAAVIINRELRRKLTEFGYYEDGKQIKPYIVPTFENIHLWIERGEDDE